MSYDGLFGNVRLISVVVLLVTVGFGSASYLAVQESGAARTRSVGEHHPGILKNFDDSVMEKQKMDSTETVDRYRKRNSISDHKNEAKTSNWDKHEQNTDLKFRSNDSDDGANRTRPEFDKTKLTRYLTKPQMNFKTDQWTGNDSASHLTDLDLSFDQPFLGFSRKLPTAIIIGVKKGGTRALLEFLRQHPDVRAPGPEIHFFDRHYDLGLEWYRRRMPYTLPRQITIEKTPCYFVTKEVPARIHRMSKDTKLILVVRDPVTRAISDYTQSLSKRTAKKPFHKLALIRNSTVVDAHWAAIKIGMYANHLSKWLDYFPREQIHIISGETLISEPARIVSGLQRFLRLKPIISENNFYFNATKGFPCLKKRGRRGRPHCLGETKGRQHPAIAPRVIDRLRQFFRPFNRRFYKMSGIDFSWS
ncbi:heparan sulfate glucosamine 3-O-sulfotransferase 6-like [Tubulanus polymorphus]|uniref:heparan sulfate glucosamine 3-O-sulfotransferase 6-like n=1 Tax=Tubulanus polymorphus TaxID=672921 RepID=UPI003DA1CFAF